MSTHAPRHLRTLPLVRGLLPVAGLVCLASVPAFAQGTVVMECPAVGLGGDNANFRGVRFKVDQSFDVVEVHVEGSQPGMYTFDVELRRSDGYVAAIEATAVVGTMLSGTPGSTPYPAVVVDFGQTIPVTAGLETFTLKALNISGPGAMYWEVAGIGNIPCPDAEVTNENNTATPTQRTSACGLRVIDTLGPATIGTNYCTANPNSTGNIGVISATGSTQASSNDVTLAVADLPSSAFLYFLVSSVQAQTNNPGGSQGNLCLGGSIGRYVGPGQILTSDMSGAASLVIDLNTLPQPAGSVVVAPGDTWNFQAWHRDAVSGVAVSNFTDALSITFL